MAKEKTLSEHAEFELKKAGLTDNEDPDARKVATDTIALVKRFEKQDHSDKTGPYVLDAFGTLCSRLPLSPLTDDPKDWSKFEIEQKNVETGEVEKKLVWQSQRAPTVFSNDEGKTAMDSRTGETFDLIDHKEYAKEQEEKKAKRDEQKKAADKRAKDAKKAAEAEDKTPAAEQPTKSK